MTGKLNLLGKEYLNIFMEEFDVTEEGGVYRFTGTDVGGNPVDETLTIEDLNSSEGKRYTPNLNRMVGLANDKICARRSELGREEHPTLGKEAKPHDKRVKEMGILLDIALDTEKYTGPDEEKEE